MNNFNRILPVLAAAILFSATAPRADETMTLELGGRAIFIRSSEKIVDEIQQGMNAAFSSMGDASELAAELAGKYGDSITMEMFTSPDPEHALGAEKLLLTVRESVLRGIVPPIEGLAPEEAVKILSAFGFTVFTEAEFREIPDEQKLQRFYMAEGTALVINRTGPYDHITVYRKGGSGGDSGR